MEEEWVYESKKIWEKEKYEKILILAPFTDLHLPNLEIWTCKISFAHKIIIIGMLN